MIRFRPVHALTPLALLALAACAGGGETDAPATYEQGHADACSAASLFGGLPLNGWDFDEKALGTSPDYRAGVSDGMEACDFNPRAGEIADIAPRP